MFCEKFKYQPIFGNVKIRSENEQITSIVCGLPFIFNFTPNTSPIFWSPFWWNPALIPKNCNFRSKVHFNLLHVHITCNIFLVEKKTYRNLKLVRKTKQLFIYYSYILMIQFSFIVPGGVWSLRNLSISVPRAVLSGEGQSAILRCSYDLEGAALYSIR